MKKFTILTTASLIIVPVLAKTRPVDDDMPFIFFLKFRKTVAVGYYYKFDVKQISQEGFVAAVVCYNYASFYLI